MICTAKFYHAEVNWRDEHYVPTTVAEHLQKSLRSSVIMQIIIAVLISLRDGREDDVNWAFTFPKLIRAVSVVGRLEMTSCHMRYIYKISTLIISFSN